VDVRGDDWAVDGVFGDVQGAAGIGVYNVSKIKPTEKETYLAWPLACHHCITLDGSTAFGSQRPSFAGCR
jgi:hypothetical protein